MAVPRAAMAVSRAQNRIDFENGVQQQGTDHLKVFKRGTNFAEIVVCKPGAKVMFLTNSMCQLLCGEGSKNDLLDFTN